VRLDGGAAHAPLAVLGELCDRGEERLREQVDTHHRVERVQGRDQVEAHLARVRVRVRVS